MKFEREKGSTRWGWNARGVKKESMCVCLLLRFTDFIPSEIDCFQTKLWLHLAYSFFSYPRNLSIVNTKDVAMAYLVTILSNGLAIEGNHGDCNNLID